ncbi:unnamed protein product [Meganyctiphanes norvegica]|uniref:Uncharacterized protein n=1 Tax=Meganyctiphanes norvegica TaxID=48144 RepID=A0AAV2Q2Z1_MEGNR
MGVLSVTRALHILLTSTVLLFNIVQHEVASMDVPTKYIQIDHDLVPRKLENINDMTPLPVPPGRNNLTKKYPIHKKNIQDVILNIDKQNDINSINNDQHLRGQTGAWKNESEIRKSKLKSVLGTDGEVHYDADWGLMSAVLACYNNHWVLRTGPEDWWTVVIRRIVQAMDEHGNEDKVRNFFVEFEGKKKLEVSVGPTLSNINFNSLFSQFSKKISSNIKAPELMDVIANDFSSSTPEQTMISHIMVMSYLKNYFDYGVFTTCGIPGVEMKGTKADWEKLVDKINRLESTLAPINKYLRLTEWFKKARDVLMKLSETYQGKPNIEWWTNILSWNERWSSGGPCHYWSGWFPDFVGASNIPEGYLHFPSDLVTVPLHISDSNVHPPVKDDAILVAGIVGFTIEDGSRTPIVEPKHVWSLLLPEDSAVADRLTGKNTGDVPVAQADVHGGRPNLHGQPQNNFREAQGRPQNGFGGAQGGQQTGFGGAQSGQQTGLGGAQGGQQTSFGGAQGGQQNGFRGAQGGQQNGFRGGQGGQQIFFQVP